MFTLNDTRPRHPEVEAWLTARTGEVGEISRDLFSLVRKLAPGATEVMHDGQATACCGDAAFVYVGAYKAHVNLGFFHGAELTDPAGLLEGSGIRMRHVKFKPGKLPPPDAVEALIIEAWRDIRDRAAA